MDSRAHSARSFESRIIEAFKAIGYQVEKPRESQEFDFIVRKYEFPFEIRALVELKYFEHSLVPAGIVLRYLDMVQRYSVDKAIIITTLGFAEESKELAEKSKGKIVLLTEADLIEQIPGKRMKEYFSVFLRSDYVSSSFREYFALFEPDYRNRISRLPKDRLVKLLFEYASTQDLANFVAEKLPKEEILGMLEETIEPTQLKEILIRLARKVEIPISRKKEIEQTYKQAIASEDSNLKGKLFEKAVKEIFELVPGLKVVGSNVNDGMEEIDIQLRNYNREHVWAEFGGMILVECKNWSRPVGANEIASFKDKIIKSGLKSGILVAQVGVTGSPSDLEGAWGKVKMDLAMGCMIVILDGKDLQDILNCADVSEKVDDKYIQLFKLGSSKAL